MKNRCAIAVFLAAFSVACAQPAPVADSPEARLDQARAITELQLAAGEYEAMLDKGAALATSASVDALTLELGRELSGDELDEVRAVMRAALSEVLTVQVWRDEVAEVYVGLFTADELAEARGFFGSPAGQKVLALGNRLDDEVVAVLTAVLDDRASDLSATIDAGLAERFPELAGEAGND